VADAGVSSQGGDYVSVSVSIGLAELNGRSTDIDTLLREADEAMYGAKRAGRNRVFVNKGVATEQPRW
jgi:diguanylate cyclase (GGDEF)-like protein